MTSLDSAEDPASYSSKNWIWWGWNNYRKGKQGKRVCETAWDQTDLSFSNFPLFFMLFKFLLLRPHCCLFPESPLQSSLIPLHYFPHGLLYALEPPPLLLFVCELEGWIRMLGREMQSVLDITISSSFCSFPRPTLMYSAVCLATVSFWESRWTFWLWRLRIVYFFGKTIENHVYSLQYSKYSCCFLQIEGTLHATG